MTTETQPMDLMEHHTCLSSKSAYIYNKSL